MTTEKFIGLIAVVVGASWCGYGLEGLQPVHPVVRRGLQVALMGATAVWVFRTLQSL